MLTRTIRAEIRRGRRLLTGAFGSDGAQFAVDVWSDGSVHSVFADLHRANACADRAAKRRCNADG
jgi:hypothetical protein